MNSELTLITVLIGIFLISQSAWALRIVSPDEGQIVYQRDKLTVIVKPEPGEQWEEVVLDIYPMSYNFITNEYREEIEIPVNEIGNI